MIEPPPCRCITGITYFIEIGALEIDREHPVPFGLADVDHAADLGDANIVVEHVNAAKSLEAGRDHRFDIGGARHVGGEGRGVAAFRRDDTGRFFRRSAVAIDAKHLRSLARKGYGGGLAIAPSGPDRTGADHHRYLALEPLHRLLPCLLPRWFATAQGRNISTDRVAKNLRQRRTTPVMA
jgi:hypothetical protein